MPAEGGVSGGKAHTGDQTNVNLQVSHIGAVPKTNSSPKGKYRKASLIEPVMGST